MDGRLYEARKRLVRAMNDYADAISESESISRGRYVSSDTYGDGDSRVSYSSSECDDERSIAERRLEGLNSLLRSGKFYFDPLMPDSKDVYYTDRKGISIISKAMNGQVEFGYSRHSRSFEFVKKGGIINIWKPFAPSFDMPEDGYPVCAYFSEGNIGWHALIYFDGSEFRMGEPSEGRDRKIAKLR